jgi:FAD-dependent sensor of blue light
MYYIVYVSSATNDLSETELFVILEKARAKNEELGVTGLMIYIDGNIIQILEGEKQKVCDLYNVITADNRHSGIIKLLEGSLAKRNFEDWSMQFKSLSYGEAAKLAGYKDLNKGNFLTYSDKTAHPGLKIINTFCKTNIY